MARRSAALPDSVDDAEREEQLDRDPEPRAARGGRLSRRTVKAAGNRGKIPARTPSGRIMSKAQMEAKVQAEIEMYLTLMRAGWEMSDEECAAEATDERLAVMAAHITAMIARNDSLLNTVAKTGIIGNIVALLHAAYPIAKAAWRAHGPGGTGHKEIHSAEPDLSRYPAFATAP